MTDTDHQPHTTERMCRCGHGYLRHHMPHDLAQPPAGCSALCDCQAFTDQPHTTTDDLTDWLTDQLWGNPSRLRPDAADLARALLTAGPLADRLRAGDEALATLAHYGITPEDVRRVRGDR